MIPTNHTKNIYGLRYLYLLVISFLLISPCVNNAFAATNPTTAYTGIRVGQKPPEFRLKSLDGSTVSLKDFAGKPVLLNFWATWCPPCKAEMPDMQKLHKE